MDIFEYLSQPREPKVFPLVLPGVGKLNVRMRLVGMPVEGLDFVSDDGAQLDIPQGITASISDPSMESPAPLAPRDQSFHFSHASRVTVFFEDEEVMAIKPAVTLVAKISDKFKPS